MKKWVNLLLIICVIAAYGFGSNESQEFQEALKSFQKKIDLENQQQKASYSIGFNIGQSLRGISSEIDLYIIIQGMLDGAAGDEKAQIAADERQKVMTEFQAALRKKQQEERQALGEKNKAEGELFLKTNAEAKGVITTASGLQYQIITEGTGPSPKETDKVKVHYRGVLINGVEFDSTYKRGTAALFPLNQVIKGWTEGLQLMKVGGKAKFFIPSPLAYGEAGKGSIISPNAVLIFEVELLGIEPPGQETKPGEAEQPVKK